MSFIDIYRAVEENMEYDVKREVELKKIAQDHAAKIGLGGYAIPYNHRNGSTKPRDGFEHEVLKLLEKMDSRLQKIENIVRRNQSPFIAVHDGVCVTKKESFILSDAQFDRLLEEIKK